MVFLAVHHGVGVVMHRRGATNLEVFTLEVSYGNFTKWKEDSALVPVASSSCFYFLFGLNSVFSTILLA